VSTIFPHHHPGDRQLDSLIRYKAAHDLADAIRHALPAAEADAAGVEFETAVYGADGLAGDLEWLRRKGRV
jgi:hypothetical protein